MKIVEVFPEAANNSLNSEKSFRLHFACRFLESDTFIRNLIELNTAALKQKDEYYIIFPIHNEIE